MNTLPTRIGIDRFVLDFDAHTLVDAHGAEVKLTRSEFALLQEFVRSPGRVLSRERLLDVTAGRAATPFDRSIDVLIGRLRRKIEADPQTPRLIVTVPGFGYRFTARPEPATEPPREPPSRDGPARSIATERRSLTVLICGLKGERPLSANRDPEELLDLVAAYHRICRAAVARFGGTVARLNTDGMEAWFGYPAAQEHAAERAVRAALGIVADAAAVEPSLPASSLPAGILPCVAIAGSDVVLSGFGDGSGEPAALGEAPEQARRLLAVCAAGVVLVSESIHRRVAGLFEFVPLATEDGYELRGEAQVASRFAALHGAAITPLVGREEELALLLRRWQRAQSGEGRVVHIVGEAGIGKSRLLHELGLQLGQDAHQVVAWACAPLQQNSPLYPFIDQIERAAGIVRSDGEADRQAKLAGLFPDPAAAALIAGLLAVSARESPPAANLSPRQLRGRTIEVLVAHALGYAASAPALLLFEDAHWIDPTSREVLEIVVERIRDRPALLLVTSRPDVALNHSGTAPVETLTLARLQERAVDDLIAAVGGSTLAAGLRRRVAELGDGVPLFVEELTRSVLESGATAETLLPVSLHDLLMARLDRVPAALEVARVCATAGHSCPHAVFAMIASQPESGWRQALGSLVASGLVICRGTPPDATYAFRHALVQSAAYESLPRARRPDMHARVVLGLRKFDPGMETADPSALAFHYERAGLNELAVEYWLRAGQLALSRSGLAEAEALFRRGLTLIDSMPDSTARQERELDVLVALAQLLTAVRGLGVPGVGEIYGRARQLCDQVNRADQLWPILWGQWIHATLRVDLDQGRQIVAEFKQRAEQQDSAAMRVLSSRMQGLLHLILGDFVAASASLDRGLTGHDPGHRSAYSKVTTQDTLVNLLAMSWLALVCCGHVSRARARLDASLGEARRLSHALTTALALWWTWQAGWCARSDPRELMGLADQLLTQAGDNGFAYWRGIAMAARGWCLTNSGQAAEGISLLAGGLAELRSTGTRLFTPMILTLLAEASRISGQPQAALDYLDEAERIASATGHGLVRAATLCLRGDVLILTGDRDAAESSCRAAVALAGRQGAKLFELRASASLARLWRDQGKRTEARELLVPIYGWFTEGFDAPDLSEARALLAELNSGSEISATAGSSQSG